MSAVPSPRQIVIYTQLPVLTHFYHWKVIYLLNTTVLWFSFPYLFCWTLLQSSYNYCIAAFCRKYIYFMSLIFDAPRRLAWSTYSSRQKYKWLWNGTACRKRLNSALQYYSTLLQYTYVICTISKEPLQNHLGPCLLYLARCVLYGAYLCLWNFGPMKSLVALPNITIFSSYSGVKFFSTRFFLVFLFISFHLFAFFLRFEFSFILAAKSLKT